MCLGALVSAYAFTRVSSSQQVVAVAVTVRAGQTVSAGDLELVEVNSDTELQTVPGSQEATVVGQVAQLDMAAGSVVTPSRYSQADVATPTTPV